MNHLRSFPLRLFSFWRMRRIFFLGFLIGAVSQLRAQSPSFRNPLDIPLKLSSNFGEIRNDHFHTGYDLRTNAQTGYRVYASADGYVSRIKVSAYGFGKVLYITHPGGYMTVYAHLEGFSEKIGEYVKRQQYAKKQFEVELFPDAALFPVKKGEVIARSGNSGSSGGPHLHFEIRDAGGESYPLNPFEFIPFADSIPPSIEAVYWYALGECCRLLPAQKMEMSAKTKNILIPDSLVVSTSFIGFGLKTEDRSQSFGGDLGIYGLEAKMDGKVIFSMKLDRLDFSKNRALNAHIDYAVWKQSDFAIQKLFLQPGDPNTVYDRQAGTGILQLNDTLWHSVELSSLDAAGNKSSVSLTVRFSGKETAGSPPAFSKKFSYAQANSYETDSFRLRLPAGALYDDLLFHYQKDGKGIARFSALHHVHNGYVPLHTHGDLFLLPRELPASFKSKAVIVHVNAAGKKSAKTTQWEGPWLTTRFRDFGDYYVSIDTTPPALSPAGVKQNQTITANEIRFTTSDNLSGLKTYNAYLDDQWTLTEYDPKNNRLICELPPALAAGEHRLRVEVKDEVGNEKTFTLRFKR